LERSTWCFDDARMKFDALVETLALGEEHAVRNAVSAAVGLTPLDACGDASRLARLPPPPSEHAEEIREVRVELARASLLESLGEYTEGRRVVARARERADALGWLPLSAAARDREASVLERLGEYPEAEAVASRAYFDATLASDWDIAARAANQLVFLVGDVQARHAEGLVWAEHARVAAVHAGDDPSVHEASRLDALAGVHMVAGNYAEARTLYGRVLAMQEALVG
jgi:ATP/maltotriose-dependent transcriptional regulator MalT